jgi:pyruvyltransferase
LLLPQILGLRGPAESTAEYTLVPNLNDEKNWTDLPGVISPRRPLSQIIEHVRQSEFVIASSLHAIVLADAFCIPSVLVASENEPRLKYDDYFNGTQRDSYRVVETVEQGIEEARRMIAAGTTESIDLERIQRGLYESFPADVWGAPMIKKLQIDQS